MKLSKPPKPSGPRIPGASQQHPRLFPNVLPKAKMKADTKYSGWPCKECELPIAIDMTVPLATRMFDERIVDVICPHCSKLQSRTWGTRTELSYSPPPIKPLYAP